MSELKHTPGPWEVTEQNGDPEGNFKGVRRPTQINRLGKPYNMYVAQYCLPDDAYLMAAAPIMLEALRWYEEQARNCRKLGGINEGDAARAALDSDGGKKALAAIAKAEGK